MKDYREEEKILKEYTAESDIDKIYRMTWSTAEVVDLMRKSVEKNTVKYHTILCAAFPGTGKTYYCNSYPEYQPEDFAIDSDSSNFDKDYFPQNYITHIESCIGKHARIFISSHEEVRKALISNHLPFTLVYPDINLKDEYLRRYKDRGSAGEFIQLIDNNWNDWIKQLQNQKGCGHIVLKSGEYISNVL